MTSRGRVHGRVLRKWDVRGKARQGNGETERRSVCERWGREKTSRRRSKKKEEEEEEPEDDGSKDRRKRGRECG